MEIWKEVKGYEGIYEVSNLGNVKSLDRIIKRFRYNQFTNFKTKGRILKNMLFKEGYFCVDITNKNKKVHRLVAEVFISNPLNKPCVNHINGIKTDNRVENLEWCTVKENIRHAWVNKLCTSKKGVDVWNSKLNDENVIDIRNSLLSYKEIARIYNIDKSLVYLVKKNKIWKHVLQ